jgi:hypothetical protein
MARAYIKPKRRIESLHFTDCGHVAVCDDGTMWKLVGEEWIGIPPVPGTETVYVGDDATKNFSAEDLRREMEIRSWIGVDLDGTLAKLTEDTDARTIGDPVDRMVERVREWLSSGIEVRIVTARVSPENRFTDPEEQRRLITNWCMEHLGFTVPIVHGKDIFMTVLWDDLTVHVEKNTGRILG